jgi:hypothetical protein
VRKTYIGENVEESSGYNDTEPKKVKREVDRVDRLKKAALVIVSQN